MNTHFSLVVPTVGRPELVRHLFRSLCNQEVGDFEIVLVDQSKDKQILAVVDEFKDALCVRYERMSARGLSRAKNLGISLASGNIIGFPDDDCSFPPGALAFVGRFFRENTEYDILSGSSHTEADPRLSVSRFRSAPTEMTPTNLFSTSIEFATFFRMRVFESVRFDDEMGVGATWGAAEGPDLLLNAMRNGYRAYFDPGLVIYHPCPTATYDARAMHRAFSYGFGHGYLFRKQRFSPVRVTRAFMRPAGAAVLFAFRFQLPRSKFYVYRLLGELKGYFFPGVPES